MICLHLMKKSGQFAHGAIAVEGHYQVEKGRTVKADRRTFINRTQPQRPQHVGQAVQTADQIVLTIDIGTQAQVDAAHAGFTPRSMTMPTSRARSEEHTAELQSLMRISYAVFCLQKQNLTET